MLPRAWLPTVLLAFLAAAPAEAVVGGTVSRDPDGPRRSVVRVESSAGLLCSGVIVAPDLVLTAAHCVSGRRGSFRVVTVDRAFQARSLRVTGTLVHPSFVPGTTPRTQPGTDLALLKLERAFGADFVPLVPALAAFPVPGEALTLAGFGLSEAGGRAGTRVLRQTRLVSSGSLQMANRVLVAVDPQAKADRSGAGACLGDSGGPVLTGNPAGYGLIGIVTWANGAADAPRSCGALTAITPLAEHAAWIREGASRLGGPPSRRAAR